MTINRKTGRNFSPRSMQQQQQWKGKTTIFGKRSGTQKHILLICIEHHRAKLSFLLVLWKKIINFVGNVWNKNPANLISKFVRVMGLILTYKEAVFQSSVATCDCLQWPFIYLNKNCCVKESKNEARNFQLLNLNLILYSIRNSTYFLFTWRAT